MNLRFLTLACVLGLSACSGGGGTDTDTKDGTTGTNNGDGNGDGNGGDTTTTPTGETGTGGGGGGDGFTPVNLLVQADFGFDGNANSLVEVQTAYGAIPPAIYLVFGTDAFKASGFDFSLDAEYCVFGMPLTSSGFAAWASADSTVWYGVDYTEGAAGVSTNCGDATHSMQSLFYTDAITDTLVNTYGGWGAGIGEYGDTFYGPYAPTGTFSSFIFDQCVGSRIYNNFGLEASDFYAFPVELDQATFEAQDDGTNYLGVPPAQVWNGTQLSTAWYRINGYYFYTFTP